MLQTSFGRRKRAASILRCGESGAAGGKLYYRAGKWRTCQSWTGQDDVNYKTATRGAGMAAGASRRCGNCERAAAHVALTSRNSPLALFLHRAGDLDIANNWAERQQRRQAVSDNGRRTEDGHGGSWRCSVGC